MPCKKKQLFSSVYMESSVKEGKTNAEGTKKFHRMALKVSKNFIMDQNLKYQNKIVANCWQLFAKVFVR